jgi:Fe-S-cluster-containing hydrogenase component 2
MSQCPTGAITRDLSGEIYHKDFCIGCGSCARNCPWGNISIVTLPGNGQERGLHKKLTGFPERSSQSSPGNSDKDRSKTLKKARIRKKAVKCDMCRDYSFIGCVYNCPLGAAKRVDAATYFSDFSSVG